MPTRTLLDLIAGLEHIDAMKIDIEGGEETAPLPFLETAPEELQPRLLIIEDNPEGWSGGLMAALETRGWAKKGLSTNNLILEPPGGN